MYWFLAHPSSGDLTPLHSTLPCHSIEPCHLYYVDAIMPRLPYFWQPTCAKLLGTTSRHSVNSVSGRHLGRADPTVHSTKFGQRCWAEVLYDAPCLAMFCYFAAWGMNWANSTQYFFSVYRWVKYCQIQFFFQSLLNWGRPFSRFVKKRKK